jgi:hypothetical protein
VGTITLDDPTNLLVTVVCGIVVALYAAKRYNTPETNRLSTTRSLFWLTGAGYVTASLTLFLILSEIVLKPGVLNFLGARVRRSACAIKNAPGSDF